MTQAEHTWSSELRRISSKASDHEEVTHTFLFSFNTFLPMFTFSLLFWLSNDLVPSVAKCFFCYNTDVHVQDTNILLLSPIYNGTFRIFCSRHCAATLSYSRS